MYPGKLHASDSATDCERGTEIGNNDRAAGVLTSAAKVQTNFFFSRTVRLKSDQFEELLRNADDPEGLHRQAKARATVVYYSSRMEAVSDLITLTYSLLIVDSRGEKATTGLPASCSKN